MIWIFYFLGAWGWIAAVIWAWRCAAGGRSYLRAPRLAARPAPAGARRATILVAARNEERNIAPCLAALLAQDYPCFEVIAIDDNSTDRTPELIAEARADPRLVALRAPPTSEGWTGKNRALAHGAERARGDWLLFTDADVRLGPGALSSAVARAEELGLDVLSLLPRAVLEGPLEKAMQPAAMGYLGFWFPLERANRPGDPVAFLNGQFLLFRRAAYEALGGHAAVREAYLEDFAFAREAKRRGMRAECVLGKRHIAVRMYDAPEKIWQGWRRIYLHAFDRRPGALLKKALDLALLSAAPAALLAVLGFVAWAAASGGLPAWPWIGLAAGPALAAALSFLFAGKCCSAVGAPIAYALLHPLAAAAIAGILLDAARLALTGAPTRWR